MTVLALSTFLAGTYISQISTDFLSSYFSRKSNLPSLQEAIALQPGNAEYRHRLGIYFANVQQSPELAVQPYQAAVALNPHRARYWLDLAATYKLLLNRDGQAKALRRAIETDPTRPDVAWEAANFYLTQADVDNAMKEFRIVLANDSHLSLQALQLCWRVKPQVDFLMREVVPQTPALYSTFLDFLLSEKQSSAAAAVWAQLVQLNQPVEKQHVFDYVRYLIDQREVQQAGLVWQQAADLSGISAYQPTAENLVVNSDFSLEMLNGGFDWTYHPLPGVALSLDPAQPHMGPRSLSIVFDGHGMDDAGLRELIPVQPNTRYEFSAYFKAKDIQGAGGPRFAIHDAYKETPYYVSDDLKNADFWKQVTGTFQTGSETTLLVLHVQRFPSGDAIRGKLWIDGLHLAPVRLQDGPQ
jgi:tetratricopeptide (TPR) repeat protein